MTTDFLIRSYEEKDLEDIVELMIKLQEYFSEIDTTGEVKKFNSKNEAQQYIEETFNKVKELNGVNFIAQIDNKIVGFIQGVIEHHKNDVMHNLSHVQHTEGWIGLLFINPETRGKGIGKALLDKIKEYFVQEHCDVIKLYVANDNKNAISIYEGYGFKPTNLEMTLKNI